MQPPSGNSLLKGVIFCAPNSPLSDERSYEIGMLGMLPTLRGLITNGPEKLKREWSKQGNRFSFFTCLPKKVFVENDEESSPSLSRGSSLSPRDSDH